MKKERKIAEEILWYELSSTQWDVITKKENNNTFNNDTFKDWIIDAILEYHRQKLREELIKFAQQFYSDELTCKHNVDRYLNKKI